MVALPAFLLVALVLRVGAFWTQIYVVFRDETFQYFEQAHRLAFGTGVIPWEFQDGIRSWLLPGLVAGVMRLASLFSDDPLLYVHLTRLCCVVLSLVVIFVGFRIGNRREGLAGALLAGGISAVWFDLVYFAPTLMTEVLAAHVALLAIWLGDDSDTASPRRLLAAGLCLGLACCLRYQYGPALLAATLVQHRLHWPRWRWLLLGAAIVALPVGGVLDAVTWGTPFQSVWLNFLRNSVQGVSAGIGIESAAYYPAYLSVALWPLPVLGFLAVLGATRAPALALAAAVTLGLHALVPHKEVRFIYLSLMATPILIGLGAAALLRIVAAHRSWVVTAGVPGLLLAGTALSLHIATSPPLAARWQFERATVRAFLAAHTERKLCGLGVKDVSLFGSGGYTYFHRDVPIFFADFPRAISLPDVSVVLRQDVVLDGISVPQPSGSLDGVAGRFNGLIAERGHEEPGFRPRACFNDGDRAGQPPLCLFVRPGACL